MTCARHLTGNGRHRPHGRVLMRGGGGGGHDVQAEVGKWFISKELKSDMVVAQVESQALSPDLFDPDKEVWQIADGKNEFEVRPPAVLWRCGGDCDRESGTEATLAWR